MRTVEHEAGDIDIIAFAGAGTLHRIGTTHHTRWRRKRRAACIAENLARFDHRLLADNAFAAHFLDCVF